MRRPGGAPRLSPPGDSRQEPREAGGCRAAARRAGAGAPGGFTSWSLWWKVVLPGLFGFFKRMRYKIIITVCTDGWLSETGIGKRAERLRTAAAPALQEKALSLRLVKRKHKVVWPTARKICRTSTSAPWPRRVFPAGQRIRVRPLSALQPHRSRLIGATKRAWKETAATCKLGPLCGFANLACTEVTVGRAK